MTQAPSFGDLLRGHRLDARLTQEALAEAAGLSARAISDLERGLRHAPHRETVRLLADALGFDAPAREALQVAARRPRRRARPRIHADGVPAFGAGLERRLVGRERELHTLRAKLDGAQVGSGGLVLLAGEPGIGKTRLLEEVVVEAEQCGMHVLWGRCWESEGAPPFWPWVEILRGVVRLRTSQVLRTELGAGASLLAELVPEVREHLPDLPPAPLLEPGEARFRLFDSVTTALQNISRAQPLLLVLDDLHWADKPSLLLLHFLLQHIDGSRVLVVGTYRDTELAADHPFAEVLGSLRRERSFESIALKGLTVGAVGDLINACLSQPTLTGTAAIARALWQMTEGNPLFVREELRDLIDDDRLQRAAGDREAAALILELGLPQGVRDVIGRRLARLSETSRGLLTIAAVIGREFWAATVEQLSVLPARGIDAALDEAQAAHVIEEVPRTIGQYRFHHALFREVLYAELPARRRTRLHGRVAQALEQGYAHDLDEHLSELAYHFGEARALLGTEKLVRYSLRAGEQALESKAYEDAAAHFRQGLEATAGRRIDGEQAALLFGWGRARAATGELVRAHEVVANLSRAFDYYAEHGDVDRAVAIAECPVDALPGQPVGAARLVARALALVQPDSHAAGRLLSRYARMAAIEEGDYRAAAAACNHALAIARREGDVLLEVQTLGNGAEADLNFLRWREGLEKCLRAIDLANHTDALQAQMLARFFASIILWLFGDLRQAHEQASVLLARAEQLCDPRWMVSALWIAGTVARYRGDWPAARDYTDRGLALAPHDPRLLWTRISLEEEAGNLAMATSLMDRLLEIVSFRRPQADFAQISTALVVATVAGAGVADDNLYLAEAAAEAVLSVSSATDMVLRISRACLAVLAVHRGDAATAGRHYPTIESARGTIIYEGMVADRLLGLLAKTMGNHGAATVHFEDALRFSRSHGCRPELAWSCYDYASLLRGRGEPQDHVRIRALLDEALSIARVLGMQPLRERVLDLRE